MDRMEWLAEKATEIGMDRISFIDCKTPSAALSKRSALSASSSLP